MSKTKEELLAHAKAVRTAIKQAMSPEQQKAHAEAVVRKEREKKNFDSSDEFEASIDRSLTRFLEALEGVERHHKRSWLTSVVCQGFAEAFDEARGVKAVVK
jgi:hypothetical protein